MIAFVLTGRRQPTVAAPPTDYQWRFEMKRNVKLFGRAVPLWLIVTAAIVLTAAAAFLWASQLSFTGQAGNIAPGAIRTAWTCVHAPGSDGQGTCTVTPAGDNVTFDLQSVSDTSIFRLDAEYELGGVADGSTYFFACDVSGLSGSPIAATVGANCNSGAWPLNSTNIFAQITLDLSALTPNEVINVPSGIVVSFAGE